MIVMVRWCAWRLCVCVRLWLWLWLYSGAEEDDVGAMYAAGAEAVGCDAGVVGSAGGAMLDTAGDAEPETRYNAPGTDTVGVGVDVQEVVEDRGMLALTGGAIPDGSAILDAAAEELATPDAAGFPPGAKHRPGVGGLNGIPATVVFVMRSGGPGSGYSSAVPAVLRHSPSAIWPGRSMSPTYMSG